MLYNVIFVWRFCVIYLHYTLYLFIILVFRSWVVLVYLVCTLVLVEGLLLALSLGNSNSNLSS